MLLVTVIFVLHNYKIKKFVCFLDNISLDNGIYKCRNIVVKLKFLNEIKYFVFYYFNGQNIC